MRLWRRSNVWIMTPKEIKRFCLMPPTFPGRKQSAFVVFRPSQDTLLTRDRVLYSLHDGKRAEDTDSPPQLKLGKLYITTKIDLWNDPMSFPDLKTHLLYAPAWLDVWIKMWKWFKNSNIKIFLRLRRPLQRLLNRHRTMTRLNNKSIVPADFSSVYNHLLIYKYYHK